MLEVLLDLGADINIQDNEGNTGLHLAVYSSDSRMIKKLLIRGANKHLTNYNDNTAYEMAVNMNKGEMANILKTKSFKEEYCMFDEELDQLKPKRYDIVMLFYFALVTLIDILVYLCFFIKDENEIIIKQYIKCYSNECSIENSITLILILFCLIFNFKLIMNIYCHCNKIYEAKGLPLTSLTVYIKIYIGSLLPE